MLTDTLTTRTLESHRVCDLARLSHCWPGNKQQLQAVAVVESSSPPTAVFVSKCGTINFVATLSSGLHLHSKRRDYQLVSEAERHNSHKDRFFVSLSFRND